MGIKGEEKVEEGLAAGRPFGGRSSSSINLSNVSVEPPQRIGRLVLPATVETGGIEFARKSSPISMSSGSSNESSGKPLLVPLRDGESGDSSPGTTINVVESERATPCNTGCVIRMSKAYCEGESDEEWLDPFDWGDNCEEFNTRVEPCRKMYRESWSHLSNAEASEFVNLRLVASLACNTTSVSGTVSTRCSLQWIVEPEA